MVLSFEEDKKTSSCFDGKRFLLLYMRRKVGVADQQHIDM